MNKTPDTEKIHEATDFHRHLMFCWSFDGGIELGRSYTFKRYRRNQSWSYMERIATQADIDAVEAAVNKRTGRNPFVRKGTEALGPK